MRFSKGVTTLTKALKITRDNSIATKRPDLLEFWDWEMNNALGYDPHIMTVGMNRKVWWTCPEYGTKHRYEQSIDTRVKSKIQCVYCSGKRVLTGFNDLATTHSEIASEWLYALNDKDTPQTVSAGSHVMVHWKCSIHGVEWDTYVYERTSGKGCTKCRGSKISAMRSRVLPGNSLAEKYPEVAAQWDYERNEKTPDMVSAHAREDAYFICDKHDTPFRWKSAIYNRTCNGSGCPKCGFAATRHAMMQPKEDNSLAKMYPESIIEWAYDLNDDVKPKDVNSGTKFKYYWRCSICGKTVWKAVPHNRIIDGKFALGCQDCRKKMPNRKIYREHGRGYLIDTRPDIASEWDHDKNWKIHGITLDRVATYSGIDAWWRCPKGHSYHTTVNHRATRGDGCNICAKRTHVSFPEKATYYYLSMAYPDAVENARLIQSKRGMIEFDIWIPSKKTAIEYDGHYWHTDSERDYAKDDACLHNDINLIRIREPGCVEYKSTATLINRKTVYDKWSLDKAIKDVLAVMGYSGDIDIDSNRDEQLIRQLVEPVAVFDSGGEQLRIDFEY